MVESTIYLLSGNKYADEGRYGNNSAVWFIPFFRAGALRNEGTSMIVTEGLLQTAGLNLAVSVTSPTWEVGMAAVIKEFTPSEAIIVLDGMISPGTVVNVVIDAFGFDGEVLYCERRGDQYEAHVYRNDPDKTGSRRTRRFPVQIPGRVFAPGMAAPLPVTIVDISGEGLGIELATHLPTAKTVAVESESNVAFGIVRFSRRLSEGRVRVGVLLHQIIRRKPRVPLVTQLDQIDGDEG